MSTSSDPGSAISGFAWALASSPFQSGSSVLKTSFSTPGHHVVSLRVTAANGLSSAVTETIPVSKARISLMQPFPIVRIAGSDESFGAELTRLEVQAPKGARVTVKCKGGGCPAKRASHIVPVGRGKPHLIAFPRFERRLPAGAVLVVVVSKSDEIGKYTRFVIRSDKEPARVDKCLSPATDNPIECPAA